MKPEIKQRIEQLNNGKIPKGYKKTDFGVFPSDWETDKTLGDLFDFYGGLSKSRDELGEEGYAYLHYGDLHRGTFNTVSIDHYEQLPKCDISLTGKEKCLMKDGDVAFLDASEDLEGTSRAVLIDNPENKPFIAGLHIIYGKAKNNSLDKWFKQYITSSESVKKQFQRLSVGFKVYGVNRDTIPRIRVAFPLSLKEQSRIAEILMKWDKAIELQDSLITALEKQIYHNVKSILLSGIKVWESRPLSHYLFLRRETQIPTADVPLMAFVAFEGISEKGERYDRSQLVKNKNKMYKITHKNDFIYSSNNLDVGSIGLNKYGTVVISDVYEVFGIKETAIPAVIDKVIQLPRNMAKIMNYRQGAFYGQYRIHPDDFLKVKVEMPPSDIQKQLAKYIITNELYIKKLKTRRELLAQQRTTLQQYLLNGIVRV